MVQLKQLNLTKIVKSPSLKLNFKSICKTAINLGFITVKNVHSLFLLKLFIKK